MTKFYSYDAFDLLGKRRLPGRKKVDHVATERNAVHKEALGVLWEKARTNYSKMLPTKRMGIEKQRSGQYSF
ncbi:hypothetical protein DPMN_050644 [Dreissena polymorpha]|uniref:Uncharacterized protein n=1 Tax=Dreissena polymorpha TaxID=45954 RepID=A0A9D4CH55_DREPO|nr:hypothetical protein DPMN_050644 [Dreissena polymorpha]